MRFKKGDRVRLKAGAIRARQTARIGLLCLQRRAGDTATVREPYLEEMPGWVLVDWDEKSPVPDDDMNEGSLELVE